MSKQKVTDQNKKPGSPVLKGFGIPILYFALTAIFDGILAIFNFLKIFLYAFTNNLFIPTSYSDPYYGSYYPVTGELTFGDVLERIPDAFENIFDNLGELLLYSWVDALGNAAVFTTISMLLALVVILIIYAKQSRNLSEVLRPKHSPKKAIFSAILLGVGVGGMILACRIAGDFAMDLINESVQEAEGATIQTLLARKVNEFLNVDQYHYSERPLHIELISYFLDVWATGTLDTVTPPLYLTVVSQLACSLTIPFVFGVGTAGNFAKKMPAFVAALLTAILYVLLGGSGLGLIGALFFGLFLGWIYAKSESLIATILFMIMSGLPTVVQYLIRSPFGYVTTVSNGPMHISVIEFQRGKAAEIFETVNNIYGIVLALVSLVLLIVGFILLLTIKKKKEEPEQVEEPSETEFDWSGDPFADL